jgi:hypothetical protein
MGKGVIMEQEYLTPITKRALRIRELVQAAYKADEWDEIDRILADIDKVADSLTAW